MATLDSATYTLQTDSASKAPVDTIAKVHIARFGHTQSGVGTIGDVIRLIKLPGGRLTIYPDLSRLVTTDHGGTATTSIGLDAYTNSAGSAVAATPTALGSAVDTSGAAVDAALTLPAAGFLQVDSQDGVTVIATNAGSAIPNAGTVNGWIAYTRG